MHKTFLLGLLLIFSVVIQAGHKKENAPQDHSSTLVALEVRTFHSSSLGWGYHIYLDGRLYVNQPIIPAISGNRGFANQEDAQKVAELVVRKIRNNIIPPTVTIEELELLAVLK